MNETRQDERCERYEVDTHWPHSAAEITIEHRGGTRRTLTLRAEWPVGDINDLMEPLEACVRQAVTEAELAEMHKLQRASIDNTERVTTQHGNCWRHQQRLSIKRDDRGEVTCRIAQRIMALTDEHLPLIRNERPYGYVVADDSYDKMMLRLTIDLVEGTKDKTQIHVIRELMDEIDREQRKLEREQRKYERELRKLQAMCADGLLDILAERNMHLTKTQERRLRGLALDKLPPYELARRAKDAVDFAKRAGLVNGAK